MPVEVVEVGVEFEVEGEDHSPLIEVDALESGEDSEPFSRAAAPSLNRDVGVELNR